MPLVRAGGVNLNVLDQGQGPAVLLVHGFPLDHSMWHRQIEPLAERYRVIAPDLRGFGPSELADEDGAAPTVVTMEQFADDLVALLDMLRISEPIVLCGLSMGGYIGWQFCRKHAARLRGLVACDTRAVADTPEAVAGRMQLADKVLREGAVAAADAMIPLFAPQTAAGDPQSVERVRATILANRPEAIAAVQRGLAQRTSVLDLLPTIRIPALVVVGVQDVISTPAEMQSIAAAIPAAEFVVIPRAGHLSPLENPQAFNDALLKFLARLP